jgi:hypothetical protein
MFRQQVVMSDGSAFTLLTTSPQKKYALTRDRVNHPLWNGRKSAAEEDRANQQLAKFRAAYKTGLGGEAMMKEMSEAKAAEAKPEEAQEAANKAAADALFQLLESKDAYKPTRGRDTAKAPSEKAKGVRT